MCEYNIITSINKLGIFESNTNSNQNIINFKNHKFIVNIPNNITFLSLSKLFSEKIIIEFSNFTKIPIWFPNTNNIIQENWIKPIHPNLIVPFFLSIYVKSIGSINTNTNININTSMEKQKINKSTTKTIKDKKPRKKTIPVALKRKVWDHWVGEQIGKTKCPCCKLTDITQLNFSCGHINAEANGGSLHVTNLRPICVSCNSSMGTKNMNEFIREYGL
jgi:hypothetical protein